MANEDGGMAMDRRELIKKGAIATGAVWAAPLVLTSTAGAATTCYFAKINRTEPGVYYFADGGCGIADGDYPTPPAGVSYSITVMEDYAEASVPAPCYIQTFQLRTGGPGGAVNCRTPVAGGPSTHYMRLDNPVTNAISHANLVFCCEDSGSI